MITGAVITDAEVNGVREAADWSLCSRRTRSNAMASGNPTPDQFLISPGEDLDLLCSLGLSELMITLEWSRLQPSAGNYDQLQVELLRSLLGQIRSRGISVWACLVDGTLPGWFSIDSGGFSDTRCRNKIWPAHVEWIGETFLDHVDGWVIQREPVRQAIRSNWLGVGPKPRMSRADTGNAIGHALLAESEAWRVLRGSAPVALFQSLQSFHPEIDNVKAGPEADWIDSLMNQTVAHALTDGVIEVADGPRFQADAFRDAFDRMIFQLRPPIKIDGDGHWSLLSAPLLEAHAESIANGVTLASSRECVMAGDLSLLNSTYFGRNEASKADGLGELLGLIEEQDATGWWQTSPIDGWHWEHGYETNIGIATSNRELRPAAEALAEFA